MRPYQSDAICQCGRNEKKEKKKYKLLGAMLFVCLILIVLLVWHGGVDDCKCEVEDGHNEFDETMGQG